MTSAQQFYPLRGGLDQETPALTMPPGRAIAVLNHESTARGYQRTEGFERFDGQPAPSDADFYTLTFTEGQTEFAAGDEITGYTTGATFRVLAAAVLTSGSFAGLDAAGTLAVHLVVGEFETAELLRAGAITYARLLTPPTLGDFRSGAQELAWYAASVAYSRGLITAIPGSGAVRGVLYYGGKLNAWRDNEGGTAGVLHESSAGGWSEIDLGYSVSFTAGGPYQIKPGDTLTGDQTGATATVRYVALDSGDWPDNDAAGVLVLDDQVGTISDETVSVGINAGIAHIAVAPAATVFPAGGRYEFEIFNFFATATYERAYGVNGVGKGFEFDGSSVAFITTGNTDDRPFLIDEHREHLFLGFQQGSLQHSGLGEPRDFSGLVGAAELGMGHELTNLIPNNAAVMLVMTDSSMSALTGSDSSDWQLEPISEDAGAKPYSAQRIGEVIYLDNRGLRNAGSTQTYGNFKLGTYTRLINRELGNKRAAGVEPVASCVVKGKDQYLLFFDDGSGVSLFFGLKVPEAMLFQYPFVVSCIEVAEIDGAERVFVGTTNGFVYELNSGTSFDGEVIEAYLQLPFGHQGDPRLLKRYQKLELEVIGTAGTELGVIPQFDYGGSEQPLSEEQLIDLEGGGGLWGIATWGDFLWSSPLVGRSDIFIDGAGFNMSPIIVSRQSSVPSYTIAGVTVVFSGRGRKR